MGGARPGPPGRVDRFPTVHSMPRLHPRGVLPDLLRIVDKNRRYCRAAFGWRRGDDRLTVAVRYRAGDRKLDWTKPRPHRLDFYGRCFAGRRYWRGSAGAVQAPCGPPAVAGDGHEGGRAARRKDRRRRSTAPATPGAAEARLADVDGLVTTNPEWPDGPCRRAGRSVACCLRGSGDTGVTSGRSAPHSAPDSQ